MFSSLWRSFVDTTSLEVDGGDMIEAMSDQRNSDSNPELCYMKELNYQLPI